MKNITQSLKIITLATLISFGLSYVYAWTAPTVSPPNGNVAAPINTSNSPQTKSGNLIVSAVITGNSVVGTTEVKGPVFTDSDNTSYSVDPNNTSNFYNIINTGTVTTNGLKVVNGAGTAGQVLTSDASGNATWTATSSAVLGLSGGGGGIPSDHLYDNPALNGTAAYDFTVPIGVNKIMVEVVGGGGSGADAPVFISGVNGVTGGTSSFGPDGNPSISATGGGGGAFGLSGRNFTGTSGATGTGSGGTLNSRIYATVGYGNGGPSIQYVDPNNGSVTNSGKGGEGGYSKGVVTVTPGTVMKIIVGAGSAGGSAGVFSGFSGISGYVILSY